MHYVIANHSKIVVLRVFWGVSWYYTDWYCSQFISIFLKSIFPFPTDPPPAYDDLFVRRPSPAAWENKSNPYNKDDRNAWEIIHEWFELSSKFLIVSSSFSVISGFYELSSKFVIYFVYEKCFYI